MSIVQFLFSFEGRVRRLYFWVFMLVLGVVYGDLFWQFGHWRVFHGGADIPDWRAMTYSLGFYGLKLITHNPLAGLIGLVAVWMKLAVMAKRCHDRDQSAWWLLLLIVPVVNFFWVLINLGILDGTPGSNRFGPSPKTPAPVFA